jgi:hypothetical protein
MPVTPAYNGGGSFGGFGNDGWWIILLLLCFNGGWGMGGFGGGYGAMMGMDYGLYPWLNNSQNINGGFRDQMIQSTITGIGDKITSGFGDISTQLCGGFAGVNATVNGAANSLSQQINANQLSSLERSFAAQTASTQGMSNIQAQLAQVGYGNQAASADLKYTIATENCADRAALSEGVRDIMENCNRNNQAVLDKLCALELDGVKSQLAQAQRDNVALQNAVNMATMQASQIDQTAKILAGQTAEVDALYNRLKSCPVNTVPVYGSQPIFTCGNNYGGCGCGAA